MAPLSLFELSSHIKETLELELEPHYWVIAEISSLQVNQKGHCYLELVEKEGNYIQAKQRATIWSYSYRTLSSQFIQATGTPLSVGQKVLFQIKVSFHEVYGLSLNITDIDSNYTLGERSKQREETLKNLSEEGLLEMNKGLSLPLVPQKIAIISSATAAGYEDFCKQLKDNNRGFSFKTMLIPAIMQGHEAPSSIIMALNQVNQNTLEYDLAIILRGGGAKTDLDAFDNYELCRAIALTKVPVITGIGHERDESIADLVAHTSLKTPTAAAEFLLIGANRFDDLLHGQLYLLEKAFSNRLKLENYHLDQLNYGLVSSSKKLFNQEFLRLDDLAHRLTLKSKNALSAKIHHIKVLENTIALNNPVILLDKGYTLTTIDGKKVDSEPKAGQILETRGKNYSIKSKVIK